MLKVSRLAALGLTGPGVADAALEFIFVCVSAHCPFPLRAGRA